MSTDGEMDIEDVEHLYNGILLSHINNLIMPFAWPRWTWRLSYWVKSDRERPVLYDIAYMWNLKKWYQWTYLQNRNRVTDIKNKLVVTERVSGGRDKLGDWD